MCPLQVARVFGVGVAHGHGAGDHPWAERTGGDCFAFYVDLEHNGTPIPTHRLSDIPHRVTHMAGVRLPGRVHRHAPRGRRQEHLQVSGGRLPVVAVEGGHARVPGQLPRGSACSEAAEPGAMGGRAAALGRAHLPARGHDRGDPFGAVRLDAADAQLPSVCVKPDTLSQTAGTLHVATLAGAWCHTSSATSRSSACGCV